MKRILLHWRYWGALVTFFVAFGVYLAWDLYTVRVRLDAVEIERLQTQAKVVDQNLSRQLTAINLAIESIQSEMPFWANQPDGKERAVRRLKSMEASMPAVRTFLVLDAKGDVVLSNREELLHRNFYSREYFQEALRSQNPLTLFVSAPFKTVLGTFVINLVRVMLDERGNFAGIVSASIDPIDIQILLNSVRYADDMRSMLIHGDGTVFVVEPATEGLLGKNLAAEGSFFSLHQAARQETSVHKGVAYSTGDERLPVLRTISPRELMMDKPLVIAVSRHLPTLYTHWRMDVRNRLIVYLLALVVSVYALWAYLRRRLQAQLDGQRLKFATEVTGVGIWEYDLLRKKYHWDHAMFGLFGIDPQKASDRNTEWVQLLFPGELERIKEATKELVLGQGSFDVTFRILRPDGDVRFLRNRAAMFDADVDGGQRMVGSTEDVTERKMREAELRIAAIAFNCQEGMLVTDANQVILRVNTAFTEIFGYCADEALGRTPRLLQSGRHDQAFYAAMWNTLSSQGTWQGEVWNQRKNGEIFPVWLTIAAVRSNGDGITHYVATHTDISLRKAAEDDIKKLAFYDQLTRLPNRRLLRDRLELALIQAKRDRKSLGLIFVDLDYFKPVNDTYGHAAGDQLLQDVAHRLSACVRESDTVARVGGDEFVILLPTISMAADAVLVAEKVHAVLRNPFQLAEGISVHISSSAGVALYPENGTDEFSLTESADAAMYLAKQAGRDRFMLASTSQNPT